jgi:hypothetical protein
MKKVFLFVSLASFALSTSATTLGGDKDKDKKAACTKEQKACCKKEGKACTKAEAKACSKSEVKKTEEKKAE